MLVMGPAHAANHLPGTAFDTVSMEEDGVVLLQVHTQYQNVASQRPIMGGMSMGMGGMSMGMGGMSMGGMSMGGMSMGGMSMGGMSMGGMGGATRPAVRPAPVPFTPPDVP